MRAAGLFLGLLMLCSCAGNKATDSDTLPEGSYHADNDIAMTVRSLADAVRVGETLEASEYNFTGVLTDGSGAPLYTDLEGNPGKWEVLVTSGQSATIRNIHPGDLLPDQLKAYIAGSLGLSDSDMLLPEELEGESIPADTDSDIAIYDFRGGHLRFETRNALTPSGLESPLMTIVIIASPHSQISIDEEFTSGI